METGEPSLVQVWLVLSRCYRSLVDFLEGGIATQGVCVSDFMVLEALLHKGPMPIATIVERTRLTHAMTHASIERLMSEGYIRQQGASAPQSPWTLELTQGGDEFSRTLYAQHEQEIVAVMGVLDPSERRILLDGLRKVGLYAERCRLNRFSGRPGGLAPWQVRRVTESMSRNLSHSMPLAVTAAEIGLSESQFRRAFKTSMGVPPHRWRLNVRIAKAQELLRDGALPITEIALMTGFAEQSHFSRAFQKVVGVPPGVWQRDHRP